MEKNVKKIGFWSIVLLTINSIIGSGIFLSPGSVVKMAGSKAGLIYLSAAVFASVLAITFAGAAKYVSKGGAAYAYAKAAFGENVGFYVGITRYVAASIAWGVMGTGVVKTVLSIFHLDNSNFTYITIGFIVLMLILLIINLFGTSVLTFISNLSTIGKLAALITTILAGVITVLLTGQNHFNEVNTVVNGVAGTSVEGLSVSTYVMATIAAFYAFTGFESVASGSEDMDKPEKNLPKAIPLAILIIAAIYIGIVLVCMMINPKSIVSTTEVVALVSVFNNRVIQSIILYGALVSMFGINVAASFHTPRVLEAMSKENQIPKVLAKRTSNGFPLISFLMTITIAIIIPMAFKYNMTSIIVISSISRFVQFLIVPLGVIMFYYGKNKEAILPNVKKNFITDVVIPSLGLVLTVFLLIKFDWKGQFTTINSYGESTINMYAVVTMFIGYVVLPIVLFILKNRLNKVEKQLIY